jgi:arginyl-tRNA synthetase
VKKGQSVKMSKRKGKVYSLDDLVAEVGKDVVRYFFSMNSFDTPMDFDLDLAKQKSNQNPVYYVQYAHARISSVIENVVVRSDAGNIDNDFGLLDTGKFNSVELELAKTLIFYPDIIYDSCLNNAPHLLTKYLYRLASQFHYFYNHYRIIDENHLDSNRFLLILLVRIVLRNGLKILNVSSPEKM